MVWSCKSGPLCLACLQRVCLGIFLAVFLHLQLVEHLLVANMLILDLHLLLCLHKPRCPGCITLHSPACGRIAGGLKSGRDIHHGDRATCLMASRELPIQVSALVVEGAGI